MRKPLTTVLIIALLLIMAGCQVKTTTTPNIEIIARPVFGVLGCFPDENPVPTHSEKAIPKEGIILPSSYFGDISDATITVIWDETGLFSDSNMIYHRICNTDGSGCRVNWKTQIITPSTPSGSTVLGTISRLEQMEIRYGDSCLFGSQCQKWISGVDDYFIPIEGLRFTAEYRRYALWKTDIYNPTKKVSDTCANPVAEVSDEQLDLLISTTIAGQEARSKYTTGLAPNERWSYIAGFALSPMETEIYKGQEAYCTDNRMYGFDVIKTVNGFTYKIADFTKFIDKVICCNGDVRINEVCQNHIWIPIDEKECSTISPCPIVSWSVDPSDAKRKTIFRQQCISGKCDKVTKEVECATSYACPEGYTCLDFECRKTGGSGGGLIPDTCGNKKCESGETYDNCPTDCKAECEPVWAIGSLTIIPNISAGCVSWFTPFIWIISIMGGIISFYFAYQFTTKKTPKKKGINYFISVAIGLGIGSIIFLYWWIFIILLILLIIIKMLRK